MRTIPVPPPVPFPRRDRSFTGYHGPRRVRDLGPHFGAGRYVRTYISRARQALANEGAL